MAEGVSALRASYPVRVSASASVPPLGCLQLWTPHHHGSFSSSRQMKAAKLFPLFFSLVVSKPRMYKEMLIKYPCPFLLCPLPVRYPPLPCPPPSTLRQQHRNGPCGRF